MDAITALETFLATRTTTTNQPAAETEAARLERDKLEAQERVNTLGFPRGLAVAR